MGKKSKRKKTGRVLVRPDGGPEPEQGGPSDILSAERASATPIAAKTVRASPAAETRPTSGASMSGGVEGPLDLLQDWFASVVTHPRSAADGVVAASSLQTRLGAEDLQALVTPSAQLSAVERLELYHYAYHARLVECLADDYPTVKQAIGAATFETLARKYIEAHPSKNPNLNFFGRHFPDFVETQDEWLDNHRFLSDLARLEWGMVEVLHAPAGATLSLAGLQEIGPEAWARIKLQPAPTLRFYEFDFPVNDFLQSTREGKRPPIPHRGWSATAIYRPEFTVWRMTFTRPMAKVLRALLQGETLGDALSTLDVTDTSEGDVMVWFREWVSGGFFGRIDLGPAAAH